MDRVLNIINSKLRSNTGYTKADELDGSLWLLETLEDIMINFEDVNPKTLAINDRMERIMILKQGESANKDFLKQVQKELKVSDKYGDDFLWGDAQDTELTERVQNAKFLYGMANTSVDSTGTTMPENEVKEKKKEEIISMSVLKQAEKKEVWKSTD